MPTLRFRRFDEIPPEDQQHVAFLRGPLLLTFGLVT